MLNHYDAGRLARGCGLVTVRQRPGTANGDLFLKLEDETGNVNVIWSFRIEQHEIKLLRIKCYFHAQISVSMAINERLGEGHGVQSG